MHVQNSVISGPSSENHALQRGTTLTQILLSLKQVDQSMQYNVTHSNKDFTEFKHSTTLSSHVWDLKDPQKSAFNPTTNKIQTLHQRKAIGQHLDLLWFHLV